MRLPLSSDIDPAPLCISQPLRSQRTLLAPRLRKMRRHRVPDHDHSQPLLNHEQPKTAGFGRTPPDHDKINS
jgi:hypothetical protein